MNRAIVSNKKYQEILTKHFSKNNRLFFFGYMGDKYRQYEKEIIYFKFNMDDFISLGCQNEEEVIDNCFSRICETYDEHYRIVVIDDESTIEMNRCKDSHLWYIKTTIYVEYSYQYKYQELKKEYNVIKDKYNDISEKYYSLYEENCNNKNK